METSAQPGFLARKQASVLAEEAQGRSARGESLFRQAMQEVLRNRGRLYDPVAVDACLAVFTENAFDFEQFITDVDARID